MSESIKKNSPFNVGDKVVIKRITERNMWATAPTGCIGEIGVIKEIRLHSLGLIIHSIKMIDCTYWFLIEDLRLLHTTNMDKELYDLETMGYRHV